MNPQPTGEELAAIAAAYLRLRARDEGPATPRSRWRAAARELEPFDPRGERGAGRRP